MQKRIGIIGGGFTGTMTAVQLIRHATTPCEIWLINSGHALNKGVAYAPFSDKLILNVTAGKMSAFPDIPDDFLQFVIRKQIYPQVDSSLISEAFLSRSVYGEYIKEVWENAQTLAQNKQITLHIVEDTAVALHKKEQKIHLSFSQSAEVVLDACVIATGNHLPKHPPIENMDFYQSKRYFQNPWKGNTVENLPPDLPVLIIGNGLTMVDIIIGLRSQHFKGEVYAISPDGFNILPHRHSGVKYTAHLEEMQQAQSLLERLRIVHKHVKIVRQFGITAEPIIEALRPISQTIWTALSTAEKGVFLNRLRHLYGVARHRIPLHIYDNLQKQRIAQSLHIISGKILNMKENGGEVEVEFWDKKTRSQQVLTVSRVINCTGPETDLRKVNNPLLNQCMQDGIITQDVFSLGIRTHLPSFKVYDNEGNLHENIFTLGVNLRGELWESTAVNELRQQAMQLAKGGIV